MGVKWACCPFSPSPLPLACLAILMQRSSCCCSRSLATSSLTLWWPLFHLTFAGSRDFPTDDCDYCGRSPTDNKLQIVCRSFTQRCHCLSRVQLQFANASRDLLFTAANRQHVCAPVSPACVSVCECVLCLCLASWKRQLGQLLCSWFVCTSQQLWGQLRECVCACVCGRLGVGGWVCVC